jgi:Spy/CpxP family protein refolding chaperone
MTRTRTIRTILAAALLITSSATAALAQSPPPGPGAPLGGMRGSMGRTDGELWLMIRAANLTPEQQAKVRGILATHRTTTRPLIAQMRQAQQELGAKLLAPGPLQPADLQPQLGRIGQLRDQLAQDGAQAALEVRAVLTPEQLARAAQTKERLTQLREEMHQLMQPPRP